MARRSMMKFYFTALLLAVFTATAVLPAAAEQYKRIVSLYPGHTDNITALGCGSQLVAVSRNDSPELLPSLPRLPIKVGAEKVLSLKPDLVLMRGFAEQQNPDLRGILEKAGVRVESIDPPTWDNFGEYLKQLAALCGVKPADAEKKLTAITRSISSEAALRSKGKKKPRVFVEATARELHTCAPDSWAARLVSLAGGINAATEAVPLRKDSPLAVWGLERVLKTAASGLNVYIVQQGPMNATTIDALKRRSWFPALKKAKAVVVPEAFLSRPSLIGMERGGKMLLENFWGR